jgi:hypothetical protein
MGAACTTTCYSTAVLEPQQGHLGQRLPRLLHFYASGDVLELGDGRTADGERPFTLKKGDTVSNGWGIHPAEWNRCQDTQECSNGSGSWEP